MNIVLFSICSWVKLLQSFLKRYEMSSCYGCPKSENINFPAASNSTGGKNMQFKHRLKQPCSHIRRKMPNKKASNQTGVLVRRKLYSLEFGTTWYSFKCTKDKVLNMQETVLGSPIFGAGLKLAVYAFHIHFFSLPFATA